MNLYNNVILITGGSSGIGLELTKRFVQLNNTVLICGRNLEKLRSAKEQYPQIDYFQCDISQPEDCKKLHSWIQELHPNCNIIINNAAIVHMSNFAANDNAVEEAREEIATNLMAPIHLSKLFLPLINKNSNPRIINITTGLVYAPKADYPFYNATKAALHSFTLVLRKQLSDSSVKVTEVLFPAVDTPWHKGNPPKIAISADQAVEEMLSGLENNKEEIKIGGVKKLYALSRIAPSKAFKIINSLSAK